MAVPPCPSKGIGALPFFVSGCAQAPGPLTAPFRGLVSFTGIHAKFGVIIVEEAEDDGFGAWSPDLPGCIATASTYDDCVAEMREAIVGHLAAMCEYGDPIPEPRAVGATITPDA